MIQRLLNTLLIFLVAVGTCQASTYLDFDDFPVSTGTPGDNDIWEYVSYMTNTNPGDTELDTSGWQMKTSASNGRHRFFLTKFQDANPCDTHYGVNTFGWLQITADGHKGNALEYFVTGGLLGMDTSGGPCVAQGTELYCKEAYSGAGDVFTGGDVGHPYIYFKKTNEELTQRDTTPYTEATTANRMSLYVKRPYRSNGTGGYNVPVRGTAQIGLFRDPASTGYHHYLNAYTQGGGWEKITIDETTEGDNASDGSNRYIPNFLTTAWQFYITTLPYMGYATPPYSVLFDDISFENDTYANQNNQTIICISIMKKDDLNEWEVSFEDKYANAEAHATYELRYSLTGAITNENWSSATPVHVFADARYHIAERTDGKFPKWWPYYAGVWAKFSLGSADYANLSAGETIYFAVKDVSQNIDMTPIVSIDDGYRASGGRDYAGYPALFSTIEDEVELTYIKRVSYSIPTPGSTPYDSPTITGPADFSTTSSSVEIEGTYTVDSELTVDTVTWTLGESSGFCVAALGVFSCTVPVELGANSIVFELIDSNNGTASDTVVVTRTEIKTSRINGQAVIKGAVIH